MSGRRRCGWVSALAGMLMAACAGDPLAPPAAVDLRPVMRSTLVSAPDLRFSAARWHGEGRSTTVLMRQHGAEAPVAFARLIESRDETRTLWAIQHRDLAGVDARDALPALASIEQLYAFVLRLEPQALYCMSSGRQPCNAALDGVSHDRMLLSLAALRERLQAATGPRVPWRSVRMEAAPGSSWDVDVVGARAVGPGGPLEGVDVYFNRAPHSTCVARTRADGVARCRLVDQHGDEHEHDHGAAVVVTYPGDVRADRVLLPTTHVLPAPMPVPGRAAFARPIAPSSGAGPGRP